MTGVPYTPNNARRPRARILVQELKDRSLWFVRVRWIVPPVLIAGTVGGRALGFGLPYVPFFAVAGLILLYNFVFYRWHSRFALHRSMQTEALLRRFTIWQVACDYAAVFVLVHVTGGGTSPFSFFFIFHVIFTSILLRHRTAHFFAALVALGMGVLTLAEGAGVLPYRPLVYQGSVPITLTGNALPHLFTWGLFAATVILVSYATTSLMELVRRRIWNLAELTETALDLNMKVQSLQEITQSIVARRRVGEVLDLVCHELARVMAVPGCSVKLLSEDRRKLHCAASHGVPDLFAAGTDVEIGGSELARRIIGGESFTTGHVSQDELFQLGDTQPSSQVQSVLFVPLHARGSVAGILGAYAREPEHFRRDDITFMQTAAELVAIALENARAWEAVERSGLEREQFMFRIAHNLRAPLAAMSSMLAVIREGGAGEVSERQAEYLDRAGKRLDSLNQLVAELMTLARSHGARRAGMFEDVALGELAAKVARTFQDRAAEKQLRFELQVTPGVPPVHGDRDLLERLLENLVSNAVKYTRPEGQVVISVGRSTSGGIRLDVRDTGIGIPESARPRLFTEFFRAENARTIEAAGTGLGLVIVDEIVRQHGAAMSVESAENRGSTFTIEFPAAQTPTVVSD